MSSTEELKIKVASFPKKPGVYLMKDFDGVIIYIGKAKELRARVRSYFGVGDGRLQIQYLVKKIASIDTIVTESEEEAFLLERDLIHKHKPRYNIRLKDDKAYLSVRVDRRKPWPRLEVVRQMIPDGSEYYGPFPNGFQLREVMEVIRKVFPLRTCPDAVFHNRARPCLEYEIKRCAGPCCLPVPQEDYDRWLRQALDILEGNIEPTLKDLAYEMDRASEDLRFEEAAAIRDRMVALEGFKNRGRESVSYDFTCDCFGLYREAELAVIAVLKARGGRISEVETYDFRDRHETDEELMEAVIEQFYEHGREVPSEVVVSIPLSNAEILGDVLAGGGTPVTVISPQQGAKHRLIRLAEINARQAFGVKFFSEARYDAISQEMATLFQLSQVPRRIECIDISNLQGSDIVGALAAFQDGAPDRKGYRRYKISFQDKPNDFEAIHEVVTRRLSKSDSLPDVLIIDGGKQQLQKALEARDALGLQLDIISLAKMRLEKDVPKNDLSYKPERVFVEGAADSIPLEASEGLTQFMQRIRDEVHRFVITFHRATRKKRVFKSLLDDIPGIGAERRQRLLKEYGSTDSMKDAPTEDLARVGRMPKPLAEKLKRILSEAHATKA